MQNLVGWMGNFFFTWLKHFQKYVNASQENKVLLLLDGHSSYKQLEVLTYAKERGIVMLAFPPHCTHRPQPLDVSFLGLWRLTMIKLWPNVWRTILEELSRSSKFPVYFLEAYGKAATMSNALSGLPQQRFFPECRRLSWSFIQPSSSNGQITRCAGCTVGLFFNHPIVGASSLWGCSDAISMYCGEGKVPPFGTFGGRSSIFEVGDIIADLTSFLGFLVHATGQYS